MKLPNDPVMLLSFINTQLRDNYSSFEELCTSNDFSKKEIADKLSFIGYEYNSSLNQFK